MTTMHKWNDENGIRHGSSMAIERAHTAQLANHLASVAVRQWEKTLTGIVALPAAAALGVAATATYGVALLERGFEVFEAALADIGDTVGHRHNHADTAEPQRETRGDAARA
jgi:hypothetical protein